METLYKGEEFVEPDGAGSVANLLARYADIKEIFPEEIAGAALPYFADWLVENVHLVEITAYSDGDAYKIFEYHERPWAVAHPRRHAQGLSSGKYRGCRKAHARQRYLERSY